MEEWDVYDKYRNKVGKVVPRGRRLAEGTIIISWYGAVFYCECGAATSDTKKISMVCEPEYLGIGRWFYARGRGKCNGHERGGVGGNWFGGRSAGSTVSVYYKKDSSFCDY